MPYLKEIRLPFGASLNSAPPAPPPTPDAPPQTQTGGSGGIILPPRPPGTDQKPDPVNK